MRIVIQRVLSAAVEIDGDTVASIGPGVLVLVGVGQGDRCEEAEWLAKKTVDLRLFEDADGRMNRSILDVGGSALLVSQFTLLADCRKGRRPAFTSAAAPEPAREIYQAYVRGVAGRGVEVQTGVFAADMKVSLVNDGPVTFVIDRHPQDAGNQDAGNQDAGNQAG